MLSIGRSRVYELIASGDLASVEIGASRRVTIKSIRKLLADTTELPQRARRAADFNLMDRHSGVEVGR